ncbi:fumarylacetoacetate hydrolase family protein [Marininema halotolerans]|uniref:Fumarylacetoacetate (FAA) hydrolase n=1 Tax=Marininema halotolerans TaxID=1155944 RepID=A0A1I6Q155_9BACL|nr:fumarylacetoacetate hydrolase family protein [Marininema halotolerans]SFS46142.1 fumarylacetoacetate (FAA) hydrolase [Marininema halotolerans]
MKLVSYEHVQNGLTISAQGASEWRLGWLDREWIVDVAFAQEWATLSKGIPLTKLHPATMNEWLEADSKLKEQVIHIAKVIQEEDLSALKVEGEPVALPLEAVKLLPPVPSPPTFRDFYAFEQHVKTARSRRGLGMIPEWYEIPVFYFSNPHTMLGADAEVSRPQNCRALDFELEIACVIGQQGRNFTPQEAMEAIAGFSILNDWSARDIQMKEMKVGLGPAKGKDFATSMGPWLVTLDELEHRRDGEHWNLSMTASVNGRELSKGNANSLTFSFAQMIARASEDCTLYPGDVIGSGTVGTGCILELGPDVHRWLEPGDVVELSIEGLGVLRNSIVE